MFSLDRLMKWLLPISMGLMTFADGDESGGGGDDKGKGGDDSGGDDDKGTDWKSEFDRVSNDNAKMKGDLEDMRMEVLSPEYIDFLNKKEAGDKGPEKKALELGDDIFEKMSKKELYNKGKADTEKLVQDKLDSFKQANASDRDARNKEAVRAFRESHDDFEQYRHTMYGLSTEKDNTGKSLSWLYNAAKNHIKGIHAGTSDKDKKKQRGMGGEKPGGDNSSYERLKGMSNEDIAREAMAETKEKLNIDVFPSA